MLGAGVAVVGGALAQSNALLGVLAHPELGLLLRPNPLRLAGVRHVPQQPLVGQESVAEPPASLLQNSLGEQVAPLLTDDDALVEGVLEAVEILQHFLVFESADLGQVFQLELLL